VSGRLASRIACVTGGGSGIGRATSTLFAGEGAHVVVIDINTAGAQQTVDAIVAGGGSAEAVTLDVADEAAVRAAYAQIGSRHGQIDIQVSVAGITDRMSFLDETREHFQRIMQINLYGTLTCGQEAAKLMLARGGHIVNMASVSGQQGGTGRAAYGASKAAIINLTQTMAIELAPHRILVNAVAPGPTQVPRTAHAPDQREAFLARLAIKRYAQPEDVARAILFLVSADNDYVTGHILNVDGGFAAAGVMYDPDAGDLKPAKT
jgi:3-oxoacyl-[acyl-carrier protein] reductase